MRSYSAGSAYPCMVDNRRSVSAYATALIQAYLPCARPPVSGVCFTSSLRYEARNAFRTRYHAPRTMLAFFGFPAFCISRAMSCSARILIQAFSY